MTRLVEALVRVVTDLNELGVRWALVGGLAVSARAEPRTTNDIDLAISVDGDRQAEKIVFSLRARGYRILAEFEQEATGRLATVRLSIPSEEESEAEEGTGIDLLFASSGVEPEIVAAADVLEILPGIEMPVATTAHLLAAKVLAARPKDIADVMTLLSAADGADLQGARVTLALISDRRFHRGKDLAADFDKMLAERPDSRYQG